MMSVDDRVRPDARTIQVRAEAGRFGSFLLVGGISSVLNLAIVAALTILLHWTYLPAAIIAIEAGVMLSFVLNDRLTFKSLAEGAGSWVNRCLRFHGAYAVGQLLTLLIAWSLNHFLLWPPVVAQALAIGVVLFFNFTVVRFWAYRLRLRQPEVEPFVS